MSEQIEVVLGMEVLADLYNFCHMGVSISPTAHAQI